MNQPCIKFISHSISYMIFIIMIITSSILFQKEEINKTSFENFLKENNLYNNFSCYFQDYLSDKVGDLNQFKMRADKPNTFDILISIWIIGILLF
jgi:hypothetical protein